MGFIIAPISPGIMVVVAVEGLHSANTGTIWFLGLIAVLGYPIAFVLGVPFYLMLRRYGRVRFAECLIGGGALGATDCLIFMLAELSYPDRSPQLLETVGLHFLPMGVLSGIVAGATFWLVAKPERGRGQS